MRRLPLRSRRLAPAANNPTYDATTNTLTFHAGGPTSLSFVVTATNDNLVDSGETIVASLTGALITEGTATIATPTATSTITDIDAAVSFAVTVNAAGTSISEENTSDNAATFTVAMSGGTLAAGNSASVVLSLGGTATEGVDYSPALDAAVAAAITALGAGANNPTYDATTNTLTFHAGGPTSLSFVVTATNDNLVDSGETIVASLTGALITEGTATIATPTATSTITDIDAAVSFAVTVNAAGTSISEEKHVRQCGNLHGCDERRHAGGGQLCLGGIEPGRHGDRRRRLLAGARCGGCRCDHGAWRRRQQSDL